MTTIFDTNIQSLYKANKAGINLDDDTAVKTYLETVKRRGRGNPLLKQKRIGEPIKIERVDGEGMETQIKRLSTIANSLYEQYITSKGKGEDGTASLILSDFNKVTESLRKLEVDNPKVNELNRNVVSVDDMVSTYNQMLMQFNEDLDAIPGRIADKCLGMDKIGMIENAKVEIAEVKRRLHDIDWETVLDESKRSSE